MEKNEQRETRDFMNVDSFSQLPFIRPSPLKPEKGIRLFGKDFGGGAEDDSESNDTPAAAAGGGGESKDNDNNGGESSRKFECHYCCRNFPTSQALGGHQNAHKRERQHAKRANLQSAMVHGGLSAADAHLYGLINYRIGSAPAAAPPIPYHHHHHPQPWSGGTRVYGSHVANPYSQPPINGSPLALWRVPAVPHNSPPPPSSYFSRDRSMHPLPLLAKETDLKPPSSIISSSATHQTRFGYDPKPPSVKDVSLDLHL